MDPNYNVLLEDSPNKCKSGVDGIVNGKHSSNKLAIEIAVPVAAAFFAFLVVFIIFLLPRFVLQKKKKRAN